MKTNPAWDRVEVIKEALKLKTDMEFYRLAGADKGLGGQWKSGAVKNIGPEYAFNIQDKTGFQARWLMLGQKPERLSENAQVILEALPLLEDGVRKIWMDSAREAIEKSKANALSAA